MEPFDYFFESPQAADFNQIQLRDISHSHLMEVVSGLLRQKYLTPYQNNSKTATGILYGPHARPIVCLPVQPLTKQPKSLSVHFLIDTAAPTSFISEQALLAVYDAEDIGLIGATGVNIWGTKIAFNRSIGSWEGINILGADYLRKAELAFECFYNQDPELEYCRLQKRG